MRNLSSNIILPLLLVSLIAFISMFTLSYLWHGVIFNDFDKQFFQSTFPNKTYFFAVIALKYLLLAFLMGCSYIIFYNSKTPMLTGIVVGLFSSLFFVVPVFIEYLNQESVIYLHLMVDVSWQLLEQGMGGLLMSLVYLMVIEKKIIIL